MSVIETDMKAGYSAKCRGGNHTTCKTLRLSCTCSCHGDRYDDGGFPPKKEASVPRAAAVKDHLENRAIARNGSKPAQPIFELAKAEPPAPPPNYKSAVERARPLLEEIATKGDHDWYRIAIYPSRCGAGQAVARLKKGYSDKEWEFQAARLDEIDQSAVYARWLNGR